jgi:hypothetical protein
LIAGAPGVYRFRLTANGWADFVAARTATHDAETLLAGGDPDGAASEAFVARLITDRPLLSGQTGPWLEQRRCALSDLRQRALECSAQAHIACGAAASAIGDETLLAQMA